MCTEQQDTLVVEVQLDRLFDLVLAHFYATAWAPSTDHLTEAKHRGLLHLLVSVVARSLEDLQIAQDRIKHEEAQLWLLRLLFRE